MHNTDATVVMLAVITFPSVFRLPAFGLYRQLPNRGESISSFSLQISSRRNRFAGEGWFG